MLDVVALKPLGAKATGIRVGPLDDHAVATMRRMLAQYGVVVLPDQRIDDDEFTDFLESFGTTTFTVGETPVPGHPKLNVITNVGRATPPRSQFHTDTSYVTNPPHYTALRAVEVPKRGGHTLFSDQYAAYATLPDAVRELIRDRVVTHVMTGLDLDDDAQTEADHPISQVHPISGRTYLYLSTPERCQRVSGMSERQAATTIRFLYEHSIQASNVYRHAWAEGDVVIWDNRCVLHRADHAGVVGDRVMHRGMVAGG